MSITELEKVTIYGASGQKDAALDALQGLGCAHLIDLRKAEQSESHHFISKRARVALRDLMACSIQRTPVTMSSGFDLEQSIQEVLRLKDQREELSAERDSLKEAIEAVEPWGNFEIPPAEQLGTQLWFFLIPLNEIAELSNDHLWQVVHRDRHQAYLVVLSPSEPTDFPGQRVELDSRPLAKLRQRQREIATQLEDLQWRRATLTRWRGLIQRELNVADDRAARATAAERSFDDDAVFALQCWVPTAAKGDLALLADRHRLAITFEPASPDDRPPTLLHNPERVAGAEGCVTFYITPGYHTWDPTKIVFFSLSLFFAMIVSDAGYGLVMLGIALFLWKRMGQKRSTCRFRNLMLGITVATIVYGVLIGSYFGTEPPPHSLLDNVRLKVNGKGMMEDRNLMMALSVAVGVAHLTLANFISAWRKRDSLRSIGHAGWAFILMGAFSVGCGSMLEVESLVNIGWFVLGTGALGVLLFSSDAPLLTTDVRAHFKRFVDGVMQVPNVTKAFGDTLSYLRLFALGLASSQLALTFNSIASDAFDTKGLGVLLAILILSVGHGINFLLGLMGGVVHGLRLNCIEFFNWSLTEDGLPFHPFSKKVGS